LTIFAVNVLKKHNIKQFETKDFSMSSEKAGATPKKASSFVHGLYVKDFLLPWDDREEFEALHRALKQEFFPSGQSEEECVLDLAQLYWQKRTLWRLRTAAVLRDPFTNEIVATEKKSWSGSVSACRREWWCAMLQMLHRALSGYDNYSVSSKGARIAKVVLRSGALRKREKFWRDLLMEYQALRECPASCIGS
jgi:hypothetical protein